MGMPITVEIAENNARADDIESVFEYFRSIDERFSTYKQTSEISRINALSLTLEAAHADVREIWDLAEETKHLTNGYFDIRRPDGSIDPAGIVKGWAILHAANILKRKGASHFYIEAGGDIQTCGKNAEGNDWRIGIRNPFSPEEIVKIITPHGHGIATSGTYLRGQHIYNPHDPHTLITEIVSLTVIGPNVFEADRFATAAFAMGRKGIEFLEQQHGIEAYMIDKTGMATMTTHFSSFVLDDAENSRSDPQ